MELLDEEGNLFGLVNAVDVLAVVFILVLIAGGAVGYTVLDSEPTETVLHQQVAVESTVPAGSPVTELDSGPVGEAGVVSIDDVSVDSGGANATVQLVVRLRVETNADGLIMYNGTRLYIGRELTLDLGEVTVTGVVVDAYQPMTVRATPTADS